MDNNTRAITPSSNINNNFVDIKHMSLPVLNKYNSTNDLNPGSDLNSSIKLDSSIVSLRKKISLVKNNSNPSANLPKKSDLESEIEVNTVLDMLRTEDYIEGEITKTQIYLESLQLKSPDIFNNIFQLCWLKLYKVNAYEFRKYICVASCINYELITDRGDALILGGSSHVDPTVNEAALRAAESWGKKSFSLYLQNMKDFDIKWLQDYKIAVIKYLEEKE